MSLKTVETQENPIFTIGGVPASITIPPPFDFSGVRMSFFPLRADHHALAIFCDKYLNLAPDFCCFRPAAPYVLLGIVNYPRMTVEQGNMGWTSQNEVLFAVPIEWYEKHDGGWVFKELASVSPFIFVDNEASQIGGREVYGWPKIQGWFARRVDPWARHPRNPRELLAVDTMVFPELYAGKRPETREILSIEEEAPLSFSVIPPSPEGTSNPIENISRAISGWSRILLQGFQMLTALPIRGYGALDQNAVSNIAETLQQGLSEFGRRVIASQINLKQFRDAADPEQFCYQAITNSRIQITNWIQGGLLGDLALLRADPSGGFTVRLHRFASHPIIETLGLETISERTYDRDEVAILKPVFPFWQEVDLRYVAGENLCWRTQEVRWRDRTRQVEAVAAGPVPATHRHLYNTTESAGTHVATGPFRFPNATFRVLPLLADETTLQCFIDKFLNMNGEEEPNPLAEFKTYGRYVYLVVMNFGEMFSETNNMGLWAGEQIEFMVPIRWYSGAQGGGKRRLLTTGLFSPFVFSDESIATTTMREVNGVEAMAARIDSPPNTWLTTKGPFPNEEPLLRASMDVFPALNVGQETKWRTVLEIVKGNLIARTDRAAWNQVAEGWGREAKSDLERMSETARRDPESFDSLRSLSLEILANRAPINQISFKQFRDAEQPLHACYQALVRSQMYIERVREIRELEHKLLVKIPNFPKQLPIVDLLGLKVQSRHLTDEGEVEVVQPSRPFYMRADIETKLGENVYWRAGSKTWKARDPLGGVYFEPPGETAVGPGLVDHVERKSHRHRRLWDGGPGRVIHVGDGEADAEDVERDTLRGRGRRLRESWLDWSGSKLDREDARKVVECRDLEPQMAVHAMLSREWENWSDPRWYENKKQLAPFVMRRDSLGLAAPDLLGEVPDDEVDDDKRSYWWPPEDDRPD